MGTETGTGIQESCTWPLLRSFWDESFPPLTPLPEGVLVCCCPVVAR